MKTYVSLELSLCICMETGYLRRKLQKCSHFFLKKVAGTNPASFQCVRMNDIPIVEDLVQMSIFLYDKDIVDGAMSNDWRVCKEKCRQLFQHSPTITPQQSFLLCIQNQCSFQSISLPMVCSIYWKKTGNLERHLTTCKERVKQTFPKNVYQLRETLIDNLNCLVSLTQTIKNSSTTWSFLTLNQSVWKIKISRTTRQQHGLGNTIQFRHQFNPTWYKNPFSSAILIFVTWYRLPLMLWRVWLHRAERKWKGTSFKLKPQ